MPETLHPACLPPDELLRNCKIERTRAGGPGGQHRNKVESAIVITHQSGVSGQASERRSQHENRKVALVRLRINLAIQVRSDSDRSEPSELWNSRCKNKKISVAASHADFPCILAEAMDFSTAADFRLAETAAALNCSTSQLIKLFKAEDLALQFVNQQRKKLGQPALK